jgi:hypothetical protein
MSHNDIAPRNSLQSSIPNGGKHTGWAIAVAVAAAAFFYGIYWLLFAFIIGAYASYDPSFATGFGALVLLGFGPNVLGLLSGATVARKAFPQANAAGLFYGFATLLVALTVLAVLREFGRPEGTWAVVAVNLVITAITIFAVRVLLLLSA